MYSNRSTYICLLDIRGIPLYYLYLILTYVLFYLLFGIAVIVDSNSEYYLKSAKEPT